MATDSGGATRDNRAQPGSAWQLDPCVGRMTGTGGANGRLASAADQAEPGPARRRGVAMERCSECWAMVDGKVNHQNWHNRLRKELRDLQDEIRRLKPTTG
jgi:hypothetical protein